MKALLAVLLACPCLADTLTVRDDAGRLITLAQPARRVVSLSPHATELIYALGAGATLVGRDGASDYPPAATSLPAVGQYGAFNVEAIVALRPDLVIAWEGPQAGPATRRLRQLGIKVYASQPGTVAGIAQAMRALGVLTGHDATQPAGRFEAEWAALAQRYQHSRPLRVVPQVGDEPAMTVNDQQFVSAVFRVCGARNPLGGEAAAVPLLSAEAMLQAQPEAIVALAGEAAASNWLARWRKLLPKARMLAVPPDTLGRPGPRLLPAAVELCERLDTLRQTGTGKID